MVVQVRDNIAYVIDTEDDNPGGLMLIDGSTPESPSLLGSYVNEGMPNDFVLQGDLAFVANRFDGLEILNISDPQNITRIGHYHLGYEVSDVQIQDNFAYLGGMDQGFEIVNITDPTNPQKISNTVLTGDCINVCLQDDLLYVTDHIQYTNIEVYNITNANSPQKVGEFTLEDHDFFFPTIFGDFMYVADHGSTGDILILDISDPTNIIEVGRVDPESSRSAYRMWVQDDILYMTDYEKVLLLVDVSDPINPVFITRYMDGGAGQDVTLDGGYIYFDASHGGLQILQYTP
ncbi:MAG: hypothetical protein E4G98_04980, partial [Promethearchaeota archaeon]